MVSSARIANGLTRRDLGRLSGGTVLALAALPAWAELASEMVKLPPGFLGMNVLWGPGDAAALRDRFTRAGALGLAELRIDWEWRVAEAHPGVYDWTVFDRLVGIAREKGVRLLPIVHYAPAWALVSASKNSQSFELAPADNAFEPFAQFVAACVRRYGPGGDAPVPFHPITHWQVWNEPNNKDFWGPAPQAVRFGQMMRRVTIALAPYRGRIQVVHAGLSNADVMFLCQLWDADRHYGETFDVMAVHPYIFDRWQGVRRPDDMDADIATDAALGFVGDKNKPNYLGKVFNLQLLMTLRGDEGKPIWITEMGFFVSNTWLGVSEGRQAVLLSKTMDYIAKHLRERPFGEGKRALAANVQRVYWFALDDFASPDGVGNFGVYRADHSLRPSGQMIRSLLS